jgi:enoyl-CoA hydratase/carnithine racemase
MLMENIMSYTEILYTNVDQIATITLNRPERMNAWTPVMEQEFRSAVEYAVADNNVRAIVVTGAGKAFCAGADMGRLSNSDSSSKKITANLVANSDGDFEQRYSWLLKIDKPLIAAINGAIAGVGLCISLYCDLRYMADTARLSTAFVRRGLIAEHGSAWLLPRLIGPMNAADLLISGRVIDAGEAASMGLVRLLPHDGFLEVVKSRIREFILLSSPRSIRIIKEQLRYSYTKSLASDILFADAATLACLKSEDFKEGVASFVERRSPNFTGL